MFVVITYDIPCDRRRTRLHKKLKNYGEPVQYSVFECVLKPKERKSLQKMIEEHIKEKEDKVRIYELCEECRGKAVVMGEGELTENPGTIFI